MNQPAAPTFHTLTSNHFDEEPPWLKTAISFEDDDKISWLAREISELTLKEIRELQHKLRQEYEIKLLLSQI